MPYEDIPDMALEYLFWRKRIKGMNDIDAARSLVDERMKAKDSIERMAWVFEKLVRFKLKSSLARRDGTSEDCFYNQAACTREEITSISDLSQDAELLAAVIKLRQPQSIAEGRKVVATLSKRGNLEAIKIQTYLDAR